ncbi:autotransporter domain-containing protein [Enterobacter hormaechei]|nr:autotransporter domain-containing protein [Enterobacter hormaechei]
MKKNCHKLLFITTITSGVGVFTPHLAYAICNSSSVDGLTVTCSGYESSNLNYTSDNNLTLNLDKTSEINLSSTEVPAVNFFSQNGRITSQGSILTNAFFNDGIYATSTSGITIDNSGSIKSLSSQSNGINISELRESKILNRGAISTNSSLSNGILVGAGREIHIENSGEINTFGPQAHGIFDENGTNNEIINTGVIYTAGTNSDAVNLQNSVNTNIFNETQGKILSDGGSGVAVSGNTSASIDNKGIISSEIYGIRLTNQATVQNIQNTGIIVGGIGGIVAEDSSTIVQISNQGIIGSVDGDAIIVGPSSNVVSGIYNKGILIGRVNAPGVTMVNDGLFDLLNSNQPSQVRDYVQATGILALQADNPGNYGQLQASGTAALNGNTIVVTRGSTSFSNGDVLSDVVTASNIIGSPASVVDDSLRFQFVQELTSTSYSLRIVDTGLSTVQTAITTQTTSPTISRFGSTLDQIIANNNSASQDGNTDPDTGTEPGTSPGTEPGTSPGNDNGGNTVTSGNNTSNYCSGALGATLCAITSSYNAQQVYHNVVQLGPLLNGMLPYVQLNNAQNFGRVIDSRQDEQHNYLHKDAYDPERYLWIKPIGRWDNQEQRSGLDGYKSDTRGIAIGADWPISDQIRAGIAVGSSRTDVKDTSNDFRHNAQIESWNSLLYGSFDFTPDTALTWKLGYGRDKIDGNRYLHILNPSSSDLAYGGVARASYDSHNLQAGLGLQSTFNLSDVWTVTPTLRGDYYRIKDKGYAEKNASDLGLEVDGQTIEAMIVSSKASLGYKLSSIVSMQASAGIGYDTINDRSVNQIAFIGSPDTPLSYSSMKQSPWIGMAGVGLTAKVSDQLDTKIEYNAEQRSDYFNQSVSLKIRYAF